MTCSKTMRETVMTIFDVKKPDFKAAKEEADLLLLSLTDPISFPFSLKSLIRSKTDLKTKSFSKAAAYGIEMEDFGSDDAVLMCKEETGKNIIFYNDQIAVKNRIKFSLAHELGHYVLRHRLKDEDYYGIFEVEANFFAAELLMPQQVIFELSRRGAIISVDNLMKWFGVSHQAAQKRIETLNKINNEYRTKDEIEIDKLIVDKFISFIDSILPNQSYSNWYEEELLQKERENWY